MPPHTRNQAAEAVTPTPPPCIHRTLIPRAPTIPPTSPPAQMDADAIGSLIAEKVATLMASWTTNQGSDSNSPNIGNHEDQPRVCTYKDFSNCQPRMFYGDEGVTALAHWFEKTEAAFETCSCPEKSKVMYATCTLMDSAWTWWSTRVRTLTLPVATTTSWTELKEAMLEEYCPRCRIQTPEQEFWNLTMKGSDLTTYTNRFDELSGLCPGLVQPESKMVERYIWGLTPEIQGRVLAARPTTLLDTKSTAQRLMKHEVEKESDFLQGENNKRKREWNNEEESRHDSEPKQPTVAAVTTIPHCNPAPSKAYLGNLPKCNKCSFHHIGACWKCTKCKVTGHTASLCRWTTEAIRKIDNTGAARACHGCGEAGHIKTNCTKPRGGD